MGGISDTLNNSSSDQLGMIKIRGILKIAGHFENLNLNSLMQVAYNGEHLLQMQLDSRNSTMWNYNQACNKHAI